jgi:ParB/RepB/Spo0J family partition protein
MPDENTQPQLLPTERPECTLAMLSPSDIVGADAVPTSKAFLASIRAFGILMPVVVVRKDDEKYLLVDGRRRMSAARQLDITAIPAAIYSVDADVPDVQLVALNEQRSANVVEEYLAIKRLIKSHDEKAIAKAIGVGVSTIAKRLKMDKLVKNWLVMFTHYSLKPGLALQLAGLLPHQQELLHEAYQETGKLPTAHDIRKLRSVQLQTPFSELDIENETVVLDADDLFAQAINENGWSTDQVGEAGTFVKRTIEWVMERYLVRREVVGGPNAVDEDENAPAAATAAKNEPKPKAKPAARKPKEKKNAG